MRPPAVGLVLCPTSHLQNTDCFFSANRSYFRIQAFGYWLRLGYLRLELRPKLARRRLAFGRVGDKQLATSQK
jgi:hypothetical protein